MVYEVNYQHICLFLLLATIVREIWYTFTVNKLVNKLMCRSLHEYRLAENIYKPKRPDEEIDFSDERDREDLGALSGMV